MKRTITLLLLFFALLSVSAKVKITRIDPTDWYVGMKDPTLQLMVYGEGIRDAEVSTDYPHARIDSLVRLDSPNYLLVYMNLEGAQPGEMRLQFKLNGSKLTERYVLHARAKAAEDHKGFSQADVLYLLMPDRFANGDTGNDVVKGMRDGLCDRSQPSLRHGGDLAGISRHLDYFTDLGVTALWFTPILENDAPSFEQKSSSYHGYATTDYYRVDPRFGTNADYCALIRDCHERGLKVVMDMIFNHCSSYHPWQQDSPSRDWFNHPGYGLQTSYKLTPVLDPYAADVGFMNRPHNLCHHGEICTTGKGQYFVFIRRHKFFNDRNTGSMKQRLYIMRLDISVFGNRIYNTANTRHIHTKEFDLIGSRAGSIHDT